LEWRARAFFVDRSGQADDHSERIPLSRAQAHSDRRAEKQTGIAADTGYEFAERRDGY